MKTTRLLVCAAIGAALTLGITSARAQPLTPLEELGKFLFFDKISQPAKNLSCASCHGPAVGWTGPIAGVNVHGAVYRGAAPVRFGARKPPSSAYATFSPVFHFNEELQRFFGGNFWDGRATGERLGNPAADQALGPPLNPVEQNMPSIRAVCEAVAQSKYASLFEAFWGPGSLDCSPAGAAATYDRIALSIAAYEASPEVNAFSSKFDLYWRVSMELGNDPEDIGLAGQPQDVLDPFAILTAQEFAGLKEFGEYCAPCHVSHVPGPDGLPPLFTDFGFENIGVPKNPELTFYKMDKVYIDGAAINPLGADFVDLGLGGYLATRPEWAGLAKENEGKFKTPTVRNVDMRPGKGFPKAYMHNGVFKSLAEVVHFYNTRDVAAENWPPPEVPYNLNNQLFEGLPIGNFQLDAEAEAAIVAFLKTLTDGYVPPKK